jgi:hypothetical protein
MRLAARSGNLLLLPSCSPRRSHLPLRKGRLPVDSNTQDLSIPSGRIGCQWKAGSGRQPAPDRMPSGPFTFAMASAISITVGRLIPLSTSSTSLLMFMI